MSVDLSWMDRIACAGMDGNLFFAHGLTEKSAAAKAVCHRCPVQEQCEAWAGDAKTGVWGGENRTRKRAAPKPAPPAPKRRPRLNVAVDIVDGPNGIELVPRTTRNERGAA
jgi:WhiB family redox-sensing transcriptional regulator